MKIAALVLLLVPATCWSRPAPPRRAAAPPAPDARVREAADRLARIEARAACLTEQARLSAEVQRQVGLCEGKAEAYRQCVARVRDRQNSSTGRGALIGLGAAVVTGGASLLLTGAGALVGHSVGSEAENECGAVPSCTTEGAEGEAARQTGLQRRACPAAD